MRKGADNKVLREKLSLNWTGPFKITAVGPAPAADTPDGRPLGDKLLYLDLPSNLSGPAAEPRVTVARCKPCANPYDAAAHRCRGYLHCRPCGRNRRRRAPCTAPAGTLGLRAINHSDLCRTPYTAAAHRCRGYLRCRPSGRFHRRPCGRFHCRPCGRLRRHRAPCTAPAAKPGPRAMYLLRQRLGPRAMYLGGFHRPHCAATAAELGPRAMNPGGFHRPHCAATAAKPGPRAMYLLRQRLDPRAMYLGGFHRPHCAATAAELGPRAMYPGGFHRPHCAATATKPGPRAMYLLRQQNPALAPCTSAAFIAPAAPLRQQNSALAPCTSAAFIAPTVPATAATRPSRHVPRRLSSPPLRHYGSRTRPSRHVPRRFSPPPLRRSGGKRQPLPRPISRLVSAMLHCSPRLRPPRVSTPPAALGASKPTVALTPSKASYTTNLSLPCPLSLCVPSPSQVYHVYTEDPHVYTKVRPLMPNLPLSSLPSPAYSGSHVLLPLFIASSGPLCLRLRFYCTPRRL